jgi:hypothetical protein
LQRVGQRFKLFQVHAAQFLLAADRHAENLLKRADQLDFAFDLALDLAFGLAFAFAFAFAFAIG